MQRRCQSDSTRIRACGRSTRNTHPSNREGRRPASHLSRVARVARVSTSHAHPHSHSQQDHLIHIRIRQTTQTHDDDDGLRRRFNALESPLRRDPSAPHRTAHHTWPRIHPDAIHRPIEIHFAATPKHTHTCLLSDLPAFRRHDCDVEQACRNGKEPRLFFLLQERCVNAITYRQVVGGETRKKEQNRKKKKTDSIFVVAPH